MLEPAVLETAHTAVLSGLLLVCGAMAVLALPWSDNEIRHVHNAARGLFLARVRASVARQPR